MTGLKNDVRIRLQLSTVGDGELLVGLARIGAIGFHLADDIHAFDDFTEDDMFLVEPRGLVSGDEELRSVGVSSGVGHRHDSGSSVLQGEVLVGELLAIDGLAPGAVVVGEITTLTHEVGNHTVEGGALVAEALLAGAQSAEVLRCLRYDVIPQLKNKTQKNQSTI